MILTSKINITIVPKNFKRLKLLYNNIKIHDIIEIDIKDISKESPIEIECKCELCGCVRKLQYRKYIKNKNRQNYYSCKKCKNKKTGVTKTLLYGYSNYNNSKKMINTKELKGIYIPLSSVIDFKKYRKIVNRFTYKSRKILFEKWNGYDFYDGSYIKDNLELSSVNMDYPTVDHKISLYEGFIENIPPYIIGGIDNICVTKRRINLYKRNKKNFSNPLVPPI